MYIDLTAKTIHTGRFPDHLVIGVWSSVGARQDWVSLGTQPLSRLAPGFERASELRGKSPMRLYQVRSAGLFMIRTLIRVPEQSQRASRPEWSYFLVRTRSAPGRTSRVQISGPVKRAGRFTNSSTPEERADAVQPQFEGKVWVNMTLGQLNLADLPFEAPASPSEPVERPTAWDRLGEDF